MEAEGAIRRSALFLWKSPSFLSKWGRFSSCSYWIGPLSLLNIRYWIFLTFEPWKCGLNEYITNHCRHDFIGWQTHCFNCCLIYSVFWSIHVSSTIIKWRRNWFKLLLTKAKPFFEVVTRLLLWSVLSNTSIILRITFLYLSDLW